MRRRALKLLLLTMSMVGCSAAQAFASSAGGPNPPAAMPVIELFTSQGCSSCPAADALLQKYATRRDVVALTFNVDYWDYLGWKDTLASPKYSARQRAYAKVRGDGRIYTPQVVVNGVAHVVGSVGRDIDRAVAETAGQLAKSRVPVEVRSEGGRIVIDVGSGAVEGGPADATIWLAAIQREAEVPIRAGENRGRSLKYFNIVRELTPVGMWSGKAARFEIAADAVKVPGVESCAVLVQSGKAGPIIGAAMLARC